MFGNFWQGISRKREKSRATFEDTNGAEKEDVDDSSEIGLLSNRTKSNKADCRDSRIVWLVHTLLLTAYSLLFLLSVYGTAGDRNGEKLSYSPAAKVIELTNEIIDTRFNVTSKYTGKPSRELDDAWTNLVGNLHIRVSSEDLEQMKEKSIPLSDEKGGYLVGLDVYHQLHCLQYIRRMAYKEYYEELPMAMMHLDHCVESLRQVLMCMPNDGIMFFDWSPNLRGPVPRFQVWHQCMNWEKLDAWAAARTVSLYDTKAVVHPQYGPSYPDGPEKTWEDLKKGASGAA
ncbi:hypothetical protein MMC10_003307 [Thelotrema lepadinum]|nr:hypothetical protein [Thelotrema lepadinum]